MYLNAMRFPVKRLLDTSGLKTVFPLIAFFVFSLISLPVWADRQEPQVQLETKIVEANNTQVRDLGVNWDHEAGSFDKHGGSNPDLAHTRGLEHVGQLGNFGQTGNVFDFNPLNSAAESDAQNRILESPKVQTQNNEPAKLPTPSELPVVPQVQDSGIKLLVTPQVQDDGTINLGVKPHATSTTIQIPDGNTAALGGLTQESPEKKKESTPLLGKIPILGRLFGGHSKEPNKKELMVFVTPTIVQPSED